MSYFPCQKCGKYVGVIGTTIYSCGCKPDIPTSGATAPTPPTFPDCNIGTAHECCVARMKRLEKERHGVGWTEPSDVNRKLVALEAYKKEVDNKFTSAGCC